MFPWFYHLLPVHLTSFAPYQQLSLVHPAPNLSKLICSMVSATVQNFQFVKLSLCAVINFQQLGFPGEEV
jgi:hypothetical protein